VGHITQVAREALSNVVQHAAASHVIVGLAYNGGTTTLTIADDGQGMAPSALEEGRYQGNGLGNIRTRARMLDGDLLIDSQPDEGVTLALTIPCHDSRPVELIGEGLGAIEG
jgi:signal transduction histidine kinase